MATGGRRRVEGERENAWRRKGRRGRRKSGNERRREISKAASVRREDW